MKYLLDTDTIAAIFDPQSPFFEKTKTRFSYLEQKDRVYISILSFYEVVKDKIINLIADLKNYFEILPLSLSGSEIYGQLKADFKQHTGANRKALKKHNIDIMIASISLDNQCILVAKDRIYKEHLVVSNTNLLIEDWTV